MPVRRRTWMDRETLLPELAMVGWNRQLRAEARLGEHAHPGLFEICYNPRGTLDWWAGGERYRMEPGSCTVTRPGEPHGGVDDLIEPCELHWLQVRCEEGRIAGMPKEEGALLAERLASTPRTMPAPPGLDDDFCTLTSLHEEPGALAATASRSVLHRILLKVAGSLAAVVVGKADPRIERARRFLLADLDRHRPVAAAARVAGLSPNRFSAAFAKAMGCPPGEYRTRARIAVAKARLLESDAAITSIAFDLGFPSSQYFATAFRRFTGATPREYRRRARV